MASKLPTFKQRNPIAFVVHVMVVMLFMFVYQQAHTTEFAIYGALSYLVVSYGLKNFIPLDHRVGMRLLQKKDFENAIAYFEKSEAFFTTNAWLDKYRFITLLSSSKMCYKEMALLNIAFCYSQIGNGNKATEYYNRTLQTYPDNEMAKSALNLIRSVTVVH